MSDKTTVKCKGKNSDWLVNKQRYDTLCGGWGGCGHGARAGGGRPATSPAQASHTTNTVVQRQKTVASDQTAVWCALWWLVAGREGRELRPGLGRPIIHCATNTGRAHRTHTAA